MTDVTTGQGQEPAGLSAADEQLLRELTERARAGGLKLTGEGGLLGELTKMVIEGALEGELDDHLGYGKHDPAGRDGGNSRNGHRAKTVITDTGPVEITVPRDRDSSFEPKIVAKRQRRLTGVDEMVISLPAKGLTHGEICAHLAEVYGAEVSTQTISAITDRVMDGMSEWQNRPLDAVYAVLFIDAINVKIREGQVANRPIYLALGVTVDGERDVLGLWAGEHGDGEGAKYWLRILSEIKNRGVRDVCMLVCDGLKGLPDAVSAVWEKTIVQTCIVHLLRNSFKYASKRDWAQIAKDLKPVYTAASEVDALDRFAEFSGKWEKRYPAIIRLWENAWAEFVPFLAFDREIGTVICTTNAIESINARLRRAVNARGHFPTEQGALKCLYAVVRVQVADELRAGLAEGEGPGGRVAVGVAGVGEDVAERDAVSGHAGQHRDQGADGVGVAGRQGDPPGQFRDGGAVLVAGHRGRGQVIPEEHLPFGAGQAELRCPQDASGSAQVLLPEGGGREKDSTSVQSAASAVLAFLCWAGMLASSRSSSTAVRAAEGVPSGVSLASAAVMRLKVRSACR